MIIKTYNNKNNEILHKQTYKQTKFQQKSRIKDGVERCAWYHKLNSGNYK